MARRLFIACHSTGLAYCDRECEANGDYARVAFLSFQTLVLDVDDPLSPLLPEILADVDAIRARAGQSYQISASGQTVILGGA